MSSFLEKLGTNKLNIELHTNDVDKRTQKLLGPKKWNSKILMEAQSKMIMEKIEKISYDEIMELIGKDKPIKSLEKLIRLKKKEDEQKKAKRFEYEVEVMAKHFNDPNSLTYKSAELAKISKSSMSALSHNEKAIGESVDPIKGEMLFRKNFEDFLVKNIGREEVKDKIIRDIMAKTSIWDKFIKECYGAFQKDQSISEVFREFILKNGFNFSLLSFMDQYRKLARDDLLSKKDKKTNEEEIQKTRESPVKIQKKKRKATVPSKGIVGEEEEKGREMVSVDFLEDEGKKQEQESKRSKPHFKVFNKRGIASKERGLGSELQKEEHIPASFKRISSKEKLQSDEVTREPSEKTKSHFGLEENTLITGILYPSDEKGGNPSPNKSSKGNLFTPSGLKVKLPNTFREQTPNTSVSSSKDASGLRFRSSFHGRMVSTGIGFKNIPASTSNQRNQSVGLQKETTRPFSRLNNSSSEAPLKFIQRGMTTKPQRSSKLSPQTSLSLNGSFVNYEKSTAAMNSEQFIRLEKIMRVLNEVGMSPTENSELDDNALINTGQFYDKTGRRIRKQAPSSFGSSKELLEEKTKRNENSPRDFFDAGELDPKTKEECQLSVQLYQSIKVKEPEKAKEASMSPLSSPKKIKLDFGPEEKQRFGSFLIIPSGQTAEEGLRAFLKNQSLLVQRENMEKNEKKNKENIWRLRQTGMNFLNCKEEKEKKEVVMKLMEMKRTASAEDFKESNYIDLSTKKDRFPSFLSTKITDPPKKPRFPQLGANI